MSASWDSFLAGFDRDQSKPETDDERSGEDPIFAEIDALRDARAERGDNRWYPSDGDLARLVRERRSRGSRD